MIDTVVSVIVPCYNVEQYLRKCVESILSQTYQNLEILLVDDGSPDRCGDICDEYATKDSRIRVIHKENGGLSDARNVAIDQATGEWVTFIDSDDYVAGNYIEVLYKLVHENNCQCSVVQPLMFNDGDEVVKGLEGSNKRVDVLNAQDAIEHMFYQTLIDTSAWNKLYHKSLFKTGIRYPKGLLFEDNPTTFRLLAMCERVAVSQQRLYFYRLRKESIEGSDFTPQKLDQGLEIIKMMEKYPSITDSIQKSLNCKQLSLAMHFIVKMPLSYERSDELWQYVKKYRKEVLYDKKARTKTRIACFLSYMGIRTVKAAFNYIKNRE